MDNDNSASSTNTVLLVIVLLLLVGFGVWWFTIRNNTPKDNGGVNVNLGLPSGSNNNNPPSGNSYP